MYVTRAFVLLASCAFFLACGPARAQVGNPLAAVPDEYPAAPNTVPMPKASSLVPTIQPAPAVNPSDLKSNRAAKPHAAKPICYGARPVRAGSAVRGKIATAEVPNFMDGNTGRFTTNVRMPPPPHGVAVGTNRDPGAAAQRLRQAVKFRRAARPHAAKPGCYGMHPARVDWKNGARPWRSIPSNCLSVDGNTGRCIRNGKMPPAPPGVPVGTTSDPGP